MDVYISICIIVSCHRFIIIIVIIEFLTSQLWLGNMHLSWDVVINRIRLSGVILVYYYYHHHNHYHHHHRISHCSGLAGKYAPILGCSNQQD